MGLFEILLIAVVALLVVGPERMPEAVRSTMLTIGRVKRMVSSAFQDIEKQVGADEIRQQLHNEDVMKSLAQAQSGLSDLSKQADNSLVDSLWTEEDQKAYEEKIEKEESEAAAKQSQDSQADSKDDSNNDNDPPPKSTS